MKEINLYGAHITVMSLKIGTDLLMTNGNIQVLNLDDSSSAELHIGDNMVINNLNSYSKFMAGKRLMECVGKASPNESLIPHNENVKNLEYQDFCKRFTEFYVSDDLSKRHER